MSSYSSCSSTYSSELKSLRTSIGSLPDFPNASEKIYLSIIVSPIINIFILSKDDIAFLILFESYFF